MGTAAAFPASAPSLDNPDAVEDVVHSYRHRPELVSGVPRDDAAGAPLATDPLISVRAVVLESGADGVGGPTVAGDRPSFTGPCDERHLPGVGHNVPRDAPAAFASAVLDLLTGAVAR